MSTGTNLTHDMAGVDSHVDVTGATGAAVVQALIDLITPEYGMTLRGALDEMSPACRVQLLVELTAVKTRVAAIEV